MMKKVILFFLLFSGGICSAAALEDLAAGHAESEALLKKKKVIHLSAAGDAEMDIQSAETLLNKNDLLLTVQRAYDDLLPAGTEKKAVIRKTREGVYFYQNRKGRTTHVEEVSRRCEPGQVTVLYYAEGERVFGRFQTLAQVVLTEKSEGRCTYEVTVAAYPEASLIRWLGRAGVMNRFFRSKTDELIDLAVAVADQITQTTLVASRNRIL
ncbi:MAG: hypothetical protein ISR85_00725 [Kiritimatiellales bacterium]|nr:hypothetical protein [Kiritimatiellota bacterium]MBL7011435.1 hypothetical protein [Kiritimatiellales bacterium]